MSVKRDESGRRWVEVEVEVPGTPEEAWQAIASGAGISSWFVPTEFREDGTIVADFGPGMESVARVTAWDPPRKFSAESQDLGPESPPVASEWIVEARAGNTCVVRVVHSLFASTDEWDNQLESWESGWPWFFRIPGFRRYSGYAFWRTILLEFAEASDDLVTHELCHVWQGQNRPWHMTFTHLTTRYRSNPYELEARRAVAETRGRASGA